MTNNFIFIGDLEGCIKYAKFSKQKDEDLQNRNRCVPSFYNALSKQLAGDKYLHVCFHGDFFDNGDLVEPSLIGLANLKKYYGKRVHIILGNRDLNKFRIYYELKLTSEDISDEDVFASFGMKGWKGAYSDWNSLTNEKKLHKLLKGTMGAELHDPELLQGEQKENQKKIIDLLLEAFTPENFNRENNEFMVSNDEDAAKEELTVDAFKEGSAVDAIAYIFQKGNIAEFDEETGILMSHGGGYSQAIFEKNLDTDELKKTNYFEKIVEAIHNLHYKGETAPTVSDNVSDIVTSHNDVYTNFLQKFKAGKANPDEHFYLLAMGLKPIEKPSWRFKSFIETCSHMNDFKANASKFNEYQSLPEPIKVVAYGHLNTMQNYPFIYKRKGLTLLSSDVSVARSPATEPIYLIGYSDEKVTTYKYDNKENPDIEKIKELDEIKEYNDDASDIEWEVHNDYFKLDENDVPEPADVEVEGEGEGEGEGEREREGEGEGEGEGFGGRKNSTRKNKKNKRKTKRKRKTMKKKKRKTIKKRKTMKRKRKNANKKK